MLRLLPVELHVSITYIPLQVVKSPPVPGFDKVLTEAIPWGAKGLLGCHGNRAATSLQHVIECAECSVALQEIKRNIRFTVRESEGSMAALIEFTSGNHKATVVENKTQNQLCNRLDEAAVDFMTFASFSCRSKTGS